MKGFKLDKNGDISISNGKIEYATDMELTAQKVRTVLGTNKGEWFNNKDEGIDFRFILGKSATEDTVREQILSGLKQVDRELYLDSFLYSFDKQTRKSSVRFTAKNGDGETVINENEWE